MITVIFGINIFEEYLSQPFAKSLYLVLGLIVTTLQHKNRP